MSEGIEQSLTVFTRAMQEERLPERLIDWFSEMYREYRRGGGGKINLHELSAPLPEDVIDYSAVAATKPATKSLLSRLVVISLNGGLGTTMELRGPKSLIPVRDGRSFLELTARKIMHMRTAHRATIPWALMNSFHTRAETNAALSAFPMQLGDLPRDFIQHRIPRIEFRTNLPLALTDSEENWCPPGHGDLYLALWQSGLLDNLIDHGIRWAFVSNIDNLGATIDPQILAYLEEQKVDFAMEVTERAASDVKGGMIVRRGERLCLVESAQLDEDACLKLQTQPLSSLFNTNSIWLRLRVLRELLKKRKLNLPLIVNYKTAQGLTVAQLETAMGAALGCFPNARVIRVPRRRFAPVKSTSDLLALRSDAYFLDERFTVQPHPGRPESWGPPTILLEGPYRGLAEFEARFPHPLRLRECRRLHIKGNFAFGREVQLRGEVTLRNLSGGQQIITDGESFESGEHTF